MNIASAIAGAGSEAGFGLPFLVFLERWAGFVPVGRSGCRRFRDGLSEFLDFFIEFRK